MAAAAVVAVALSLLQQQSGNVTAVLVDVVVLVVVIEGASAGAASPNLTVSARMGSAHTQRKNSGRRVVEGGGGMNVASISPHLPSSFSLSLSCNHERAIACLYSERGSSAKGERKAVCV